METDTIPLAAPAKETETIPLAAPAKETEALPSWSPVCTAEQFGADECQCLNCAKAKLS